MVPIRGFLKTKKVMEAAFEWEALTQSSSQLVIQSERSTSTEMIVHGRLLSRTVRAISYVRNVHYF